MNSLDAIATETTPIAEFDGAGSAMHDSSNVDSKDISSGINDEPIVESSPIPIAQGSNFQSILVLGLLLLGVGFIYGPKLLSQPALGVSDESSGYSYVVDLDFWRRTDREKSVRAAARFDLDSDMATLPLSIGTWEGQEKPETNREVQILLEPEQYVRRLYQDQDSGQYMWLSVIGGRSSQPFHAPDICYDADGWQYSMGSRGFTLEQGGEIHGLYLDAQKTMPEAENQVSKHVVSYFYVFPDHDRSIADGIVLFKLTSNRLDSITESLDLHEDFVNQFFTSAN